MTRGRDARWVYQKLLKKFGPQGWWPVTPAGRRAPVYAPRNTRGRLTEREQFEVALGAILTQNTAWTNVEKALRGLQARGALASPAALLKLPRRTLQKAIRSSGYFRQKAARVAGLARYFQKNWRGRLAPFLDRPAARVREELLALHGVGPETADSIALYAGGHPQFVVDAYTRRFGQRFGFFKKPTYDAMQNFFMTHIPSDVRVYREYHALIVALAKAHCRARPQCAGCPVGARCAASPQNG